MRQTSILAFNSIKKDLNFKQKLVLNALEEITPASDRQIAERLNWPINTVTPRRGELYESGKVIEAYKDHDSKTGRLVTFWQPKMTNSLLFEDVQ